MKHAGRAIILALAVLMLASGGFASIAFAPSEKQANLSRNDSIGLQFRLKNLGNDKACIDLSTTQNDSYIEATLSQEEICLNAYESTNVTISIRTRNAPRGLQTITLEAESNEGNANAVVSLYVSEEPEIELVASSTDVCIGFQQYVNVLVRNNSDEFKDVELQAENEMLLPYFGRKEITLTPFQEKYVELRLHPSPYSSEGRHYVSMYAITEDEVAKKRIAIDVVECGEEESPEFSVRINSKCFVAEKGEPERIYFTVLNRLGREQKVYFSVGGKLDARMQTYSAWLEENEEREFYFEVEVDEEAKVMDYYLKLRVWNQDYSVEKSVCIRPRRMHLTSVEVEENDLVIRQCESAVFTITLKNTGDYSEDFELRLDSDYSKIEALLSEDDVELEKQSSKQVYVSVNVFESAPEGDYIIVLGIEAALERFEKQLRFTVVPEEKETELPLLEIVGYASSLRMDENSEKTLLVSVKNNGGQQLDGISISIWGLPIGITSTTESNVSLLPGQAKAFELAIRAAEGTIGEYNPVLQANSPEQSDEKGLRLIVEAAKEDGEETVLTGLVGLFAAGGSALLGLAALVVIILALVLVSRTARAPGTQSKKEIWVRG